MSAFSDLRDKDYSTVTDAEKCLLEVWEMQGLEYLAKNGAAELAALHSELDALKVAAKNLLNEVPEGEIELIREVWGNTNTRILLERRSELAAALAGNK